MEKFRKRYLACYYVSVCKKSNAYLQFCFKQIPRISDGKKATRSQKGKAVEKVPVQLSLSDSDNAEGHIDGGSSRYVPITD